MYNNLTAQVRDRINDEMLLSNCIKSKLSTTRTGNIESRRICNHFQLCIYDNECNTIQPAYYFIDMQKDYDRITSSEKKKNNTGYVAEIKISCIFAE
ncbi:MAG: hypothetical protein LBL13_05705 [Bacteroidales bacterium]|jgi:hypothetical protein|nr:hypothetical protein [Bacteroidales bacterium]